jgi:hypothetical protein
VEVLLSGEFTKFTWMYGEPIWKPEGNDLQTVEFAYLNLLEGILQHVYAFVAKALTGKWNHPWNNHD